MDVIKIEDLEAYKLAEGITQPDKRCGTCGHHVGGRCMWTMPVGRIWILIFWRKNDEQRTVERYFEKPQEMVG